MKKIIGLVRNHLKADFGQLYYLSITAFLGTGLLLNSYLDMEALIDQHQGTYWRLIGYFLLYSFAYYGGLALVLLFNPSARSKMNWKFLSLSLTGMVVLSVDSGFPYFYDVLAWIHTDFSIFSWTYSIVSNASGLLFVTVPLFLVYILFFRSSGEAFGLSAPQYDARPYFLLLLLMVPLIAGASFTSGFINYYPTYKPNTAAEFLSVPKWIPLTGYELCYAFDFFNVELLFRGFLVVGLSRLLGKDAIMPMVTTYCFLHFGKPTGEAISSIFGGYLLGVLACYTRGIWGGVIIHIGIAWMMEFFAFIQK